MITYFSVSTSQQPGGYSTTLPTAYHTLDEVRETRSARMGEEEHWQPEGAEEASVVPWLSSFAGGFWAGLEPMFLLTFLIATFGALAFM